MDFISAIILLGIVQGMFLGVLLVTTRRGNRTANKLLGILMISFSISISGFFFLRIGDLQFVPFLVHLPPSVLFLFGPLFYFYVRSLTRRNFKFRPEHLLHFLPFFLVLVFRVPYYLVISGTAAQYSNAGVSYIITEGIIILIVQIIHLFIYIHFIRRLLKRHIAVLKKSRSSIDKINLNWINFIIGGFYIIFGLMAMFIVFYFFKLEIYKYYMSVIPISVSIAIYAMGYLGFKQPQIFSSNGFHENKKYKRSTLNPDFADDHLSRLIETMKGDKPYLDSNLTLPKLSKMVAIQPHHLSQIINEKLNQNFFDFINYYRVEEAKLLFADPRGELLTVLAIAEEVGFNSKSAFNTAFKKYTGMTPTQYKSKINHVEGED